MLLKFKFYTFSKTPCRLKELISFSHVGIQIIYQAKITMDGYWLVFRYRKNIERLLLNVQFFIKKKQMRRINFKINCKYIAILLIKYFFSKIWLLFILLCIFAYQNVRFTHTMNGPLSKFLVDLLKAILFI